MNQVLEAEEKMQSSIAAMENRFVNIRAGRANPAMVSGVMVDYYGSKTPINAIATMSVPEPRQLFIKPYDRSSIKDIERAINEANIGIAPTNNGEIVILNVPALTEEKRKDYVKQIKLICEECKVSLRNVRQDANNDIKKEKLPEDQEKGLIEDIQDLITKYNKIADEKAKEKETELMSI